MPKIIDSISALLGRRKPVTREEAAEIADWVGEGGAPDPDGPPRIVDRRKDR